MLSMKKMHTLQILNPDCSARFTMCGAAVICSWLLA